MEKAFEELKKEGLNSVDSLIKWMKDANIIDKAKETEAKTREMFQGVDEKKIELEKFLEVVGKVALEQKKTVEDMSKNLMQEGTKFLEALKAGADAFKKHMEEK